MDEGGAGPDRDVLHGAPGRAGERREEAARGWRRHRPGLRELPREVHAAGILRKGHTLNNSVPEQSPVFSHKSLVQSVPSPVASATGLETGDWRLRTVPL